MVKEKVVQILGKKYSPKIYAYLLEKNILNRLGLPYSYSSIQKVVNGSLNNEEMILAITYLLEIQIKKKQKLQKKLNKINL